MMKFYLRLRHVLIVGLLLTSIAGWSQQTRITGRVVSSEDDTALPGVSILEKGTTNGTVTDADGNYSISVANDAVLIFSFVGYSSQEVPVAGQSAINVTLQTDVTALGEVLVIGYGEVQKKDATGAVMNISNKDFNKGVLASPQDLLVGKFAGVSITSNSGAPGSGSTIRIRGGSSLSASNDPLIVIDGFPVSDNTATGAPNGISNPLASINPNDIESVTVLKDASATAIYGSRASNGVLIITTKKGVAGRLSLSYNANVSISKPVKYLDVLNATEYKEMIDDLEAQGVLGIDAEAKERLGDANTDWQKEIFRTSVSHDHNLSASGSVKNVPYRVSYGYTDQQGILKTTAIQRHSLNLNVNPTLLNDNLKLNFSLKGAITDSNFGETAAIGNAVSFDPTQVVRDVNDDDLAPFDGYFTWLKFRDPNTGAATITSGNANPVAQLEQTNNKGTAKRILGGMQAEYRLPFLKEVKVTVNTGFDQAISDGYNIVPLNAGFQHSTGVLNGKYNTYKGINRSELLDIYGNYTKDIGDHRIDLTAGYGWQHFYREGWNRDSSTVTTTFTEFKNENFLVSFFGRLNYTYKGKYLVTATLREDGSSRFSKENRWGLFPAVALAWQLKEENFLAGVEVLSHLKLRGGYGVTGQQELPGTLNNAYYPYLAVYRESNLLAQYQLGDEFYITQRPEAYDANIKWEETTTYNLGVDFGFFNDNLTGSVEVFQKDTKDLLNYIGVANGSTFSNFLTTNVGSMTNKGVEVTLNAMPVSTPDFTWNIGINFTSIKSEITKLNLTDDPTYPGVSKGGVGVGANIQNDQVGFPVSSFYAYQQVYGADGRPLEGIYVDRSGEGGSVVGNVNNYYHYQKPAADYLVGLNSRVRYKQFDFSFSSRLSIGNYVYNNVLSGRAYYNAVYSLLHFRNVPTAIHDTEFFSQQLYSDYYIENASFFKMDNISAGYSFDRIFTEKLKGRLSFTVQNAFTITDYSGIDPEVDNSGIDNNIYPRPRTFLVGINLTY